MSEKDKLNADESGTVHISDDVIASIAALAASEVEGVAMLSTGSGVDFGEWLGRKSLTKGVKIAMQERTAMVELSLTVRYGHSIPTVARHVQEKVKDAVESMTGLIVGEVAVHVCGVTFPKEKSKAGKAKEPGKQKEK